MRCCLKKEVKFGRITGGQWKETRENCRRLEALAELTDIHGTKTLLRINSDVFISLKPCYTHIKKLKIDIL